jgi:hypothetical protein
MSLAGTMPAPQAADTIAHDGARRFSTFYGYYMLQALARAGDYDRALDLISTYWGGMLDLGATTFWEDFDIDWLNNAGRIDELPDAYKADGKSSPDGKIDVHRTYGNYCYKGLRHSLCHGWASGPTAWMSEHILGIKALKPGYREVRIEPHLGKLKWARGTFPTPYGDITVEHRRTADGHIESKIEAPEGITVRRN